jgi:hypothetical protein
LIFSAFTNWFLSTFALSFGIVLLVNTIPAKEEFIMSRRKNAILIVTGVIAGAMLTGPTAQAAEAYLKALPSSQTIYLDGDPVSWTAYHVAD